MFAYTLKKLANDIQKIALEIDPDSNPQYLEDDASVTLRHEQCDPGDRVVIYLGNIFQQAKNLSRADRRKNIRALLESTLSTAEQTPDAWMASLRLRARTPEEIVYRRQYEMLNGASSFDPVTYGDDQIVLELVADSTNYIALVFDAQLDKVELSREQGFKMAAAALVRATDSAQWHGESGIWASCYSDDYDFARLLAAGANSRLPFTGDQPVVFAPSHSVCMITNRDDAETISTMLNVGTKMAEGHRPLSHLLWTQDSNGSWVPYINDNDIDVANLIALQQVKEIGSNYSDQKAVLEKVLESENKDIFVAAYTAFMGDEGSVTSVCSYTLNVPCYLPRSDMVSVTDYDSQAHVGTLTWAAFEAILGSDTLQFLPEHLPARYAVLEPLTPEQETALKAAAK